MTERKRGLPFSVLLTGIIFAIIVVALLAGIWMNYVSSRYHLEKNAQNLRHMTESHIDTSFRMIDTGLKIYDNTYNDEMEEAFGVVNEEYARAGGDPSRINLSSLQEKIGGMEIHFINNQCIVEYSSDPPDAGLDFSVIYPDFCAYLHGIWNTTGYFPDRVVMDWNTGYLEKFGYMPAPDHRFIIELGLHSEALSTERMELQHGDVIREVREFNPYVKDVLLFQKQKRLVDNASYVPTPEESAMLDYILWENRSTQVVKDDPGETTVWEVIDLRDPAYGADTSIFAKISYDDALLAGELEKLALLHGLAAVLVVFSGGLVAMVVSRRVSRPIERLLEDVDRVAAGDICHPIRPAPGYELSLLAESIQAMIDRLRAEMYQCRVSEERFVNLVTLLPVGVFETDLSGKVTFANPAGLEAFGYTPGDLRAGTNIFSIVAPEDRDRAKHQFSAILQGQRTEGSEYTGLRRDGTSVPIMVYTSARREGGKVTGMRGVVLDISRMKSVEAEIRQLNAELEQRVADRTRELERAMGEMEAFTYSVSHDLRAPLRAIDGFSHILSDSAGTRLTETELRAIRVIRQNVELMDQLIEGVLSLSRLGWKDISREWVDPVPLVREVIAELEALEKERTIEFSVRELPPCYADRVMLRMVFSNLIGNAVKFTRNVAKARVGIGSLVEDSRVVYFVRDNGAGFDMKYSQKIFEPFQRLHTQDEFEGSGIGLTIVDRIVRRHGGQVWARSVPGEGTTFFFTLGGDSGSPPG